MGNVFSKVEDIYKHSRGVRELVFKSQDETERGFKISRNSRSSREKIILNPNFCNNLNITILKKVFIVV